MRLMNFDCRSSWARPVRPVVRVVVQGLGLVGLWVTLGGWAQAQVQLTPDTLMAGSVQGTGPHLTDLGQAIEHFAAHDIEGSRKLLVEARKKTPRLPPVGVMMARMFLFNNLTIDARIELEQGALESPDDPEAFLMLGELDLNEHQFAASRLLTNRSMDLADALKDNSSRRSSLLSKIFQNLVMLEVAQQQWDPARTVLAKWVRQDPENAIPHAQLGNVLFQLKRVDEAFKEYQIAYEKDPKLVPPEIAMSRLYRLAKDLKMSRQWIQKALVKGSKDVATLLAVSQLHLDNNALDEAEKFALDAGKLDAKNFEAKKMMGTVARFKHENEKAKKFLEAAHVQSPKDPIVIRLLALTLIEFNDEKERDRAVQYGELGVLSSPGDPEAAAALGWIYFRMGRNPEAANYLMAAVSKRNSVSADLAYYIAVLDAKTGRLPEAIGFLESAMSYSGPFFYRKDCETLHKELVKKRGGGTTADEFTEKNAKSEVP